MENIITQLQKQSWNETQSRFCFTIYGSQREKEKTDRERKDEMRRDKKENNGESIFHLPLDTFPSPDLQL